MIRLRPRGRCSCSNTKKRILDEVRASSTDVIPDVVERSRSKGRKDKERRESRTKRDIAVQTDDPGLRSSLLLCHRRPGHSATRV